MNRALLLASLLWISGWISAQKVSEPPTTAHPEWSRPFPPFQIAGNLYYVGTYDLACYLIITPKGNILINTGLASSAALVKQSIETLGFRFSDIKILLTTQAHFDHLGAMAIIKKRTGAKMMVDEGDADVVADGGLSDYDLKGDVCVFEPVKVDRILHNGELIKLGGTQLTILHHPGHTKGSCSYLLDVKDSARTYRVLIANMPTIITNRSFSAVPKYPHIARDYAYTLNAMKRLNFDLWVASHGSQFDLTEKHPSGTVYNPAAFMDKKVYYDEIEDLQKEYDKKISGR